MPIDKSHIKEGTFMTGCACAGHFSRARNDDENCAANSRNLPAPSKRPA
jgi:hypothetical protein